MVVECLFAHIDLTVSYTLLTTVTDLQEVLASLHISQSLNLQSYFEWFPNFHQMMETVTSLAASSSCSPSLSKFVALDLWHLSHRQRSTRGWTTLWSSTWTSTSTVCHSYWAAFRQNKIIYITDIICRFSVKPSQHFC